MLIIFIFILYKQHNRLSFVPWITLSFLTFLPTYITFTNDTYLYLPLACFIITINLILIGIDKKTSFVLFSIPTIVIFLFLYKTHQASMMWWTDKNLWQYSYEQEESPHTSVLLGLMLLDLKQPLGIEFLHSGGKNFDLKSNPEILKYFVFRIYQAKIPVSKKIEVLRDCYTDHMIYNAYMALVLLDGNYKESEEGKKMWKATMKPQETYGPKSDGYAAITTLINLCKNNANKQFICNDLKIKY